MQGLGLRVGGVTGVSSLECRTIKWTDAVRLEVLLAVNLQPKPQCFSQEALWA